MKWIIKVENVSLPEWILKLVNNKMSKCYRKKRMSNFNFVIISFDWTGRKKFLPAKCKLGVPIRGSYV